MKVQIRPFRMHAQFVCDDVNRSYGCSAEIPLSGVQQVTVPSLANTGKPYIECEVEPLAQYGQALLHFPNGTQLAVEVPAEVYEQFADVPQSASSETPEVFRVTLNG